MSVAYKITTDFRGASTLLDTVIQSLDGPARSDLNRIGATAARTSLTRYHTDFERGGGWENPSLSTHGAGRIKTRFGEEIARAWSVEDVEQDSVQLVNAAPHYKFKVTGGTITAKRVSHLTIPVHPTAHGRMVAVWRRIYGSLWQPNGRDFLMGVVNGRARVIYALKKSVSHAPWKGALPDEGVYLDPFVEAIEKEIFANL